MANTVINESFIDIYNTTDEREVQETDSRTDNDSVEGNSQNELYQMLELDESKQEVINKSLMSKSKKICAFRLILTAVVVAVIIAVVISFTTDTKNDINECTSNPCLNGSCTDLVDGYRCTCFAGYSGLDCQTDIDECISDPCVNGICINGLGNYSCSCTDGFGGTDCEHSITDCVDILSYNGNRTDGLFTVRTWKSHTLINVYCDMTTDGGGWTVIQYRFDGTTEFYRNFYEYDAGFGKLTAEFWLGLSIIQEIAGQGQTDLRIDLEAANGTKAYETFDNFYLSPGPAYTLHLGPTIASLRISSSYSFRVSHNAKDFSTYDHDADSYSHGNCAFSNQGGWWYKACYAANLNGRYLTPGTNANRGMTYKSFMNYTSLKTSKMMIRRK